ncbi:MAG: glycine/sarcosine/betaine reductase selenoprotein B family protein [Syntrophales bacterium]|nr:glycine/sarcosine/betaine reductase selenoprotein B family protein [Syntrophales bacterium]
MYQLRAYRSFVSYMDRSREYYAASGYTRPYEWPHYDAVPFTPLKKPLAQCRVGLVTTAGKPKPPEAGVTLLTSRELYAEPANPPPQRLFTDDLSWDKQSTHTDDVDSFLPVNRLREYAAEGRIGSASARFYGVTTDYSQSRTLERYAPQILEWCREDGLDAVLLSAL